MRQNNVLPAGAIFGLFLCCLLRYGFEPLLTFLGGVIGITLKVAWMIVPSLGAIYLSYLCWVAAQSFERSYTRLKMIATIGFGIAAAIAALGVARIWGVAVGLFFVLLGMTSSDFGSVTWGAIFTPMNFGFLCAFWAIGRDVGRRVAKRPARVVHVFLLYGGYMLASYAYACVFLADAPEIMPVWWDVMWTVADVVCLIVGSATFSSE